MDENNLPLTSTAEETDKKCPSCGATLTYNPQTEGLLCEYCGYERKLTAEEAFKGVSEQDFLAAKNRQSFTWGKDKKQVICSNCGGESIYDALETASTCPFCGSTSVMPAADQNSIAPGGVCPFSLSSQQAGQAFKHWIRSQIFAPRAAKVSGRADTFRGIYLPYWTFDTRTVSTFSGAAGFDKTVRRGDRYVTSTTWRSVSGTYERFIDDLLVSASKRQGNYNLRAAEPFDFAKMMPYHPELLAGFVAERYSVGLDDGWSYGKQLIQERLQFYLEGHIRTAWSADQGRVESFTTEYDQITYKYVLVPIWLSSYQYKGQQYQIVINGQTGKVSGKTPVSILRVGAVVLLCLLIIFMFLYFVNR